MSLMAIPVAIGALRAPESPRWLHKLNDGRWKSAMRSVAAINGREGALRAILPAADYVQRHPSFSASQGSPTGSAAGSGSVLALLADPVLRCTSAVVW